MGAMKNPSAEDLALQLFERTCQAAVEVECMRFAWVGWVDRPNSRVVPLTMAGHGYGYLDDIFITLGNSPYGRGPTARAAREGRPRATYDMSRDPDYWPWMIQALSRGYRSGGSFPIHMGGQVAAVLCLYSGNRGYFDAVQLARFNRIAESVSHVLGAILADPEKMRVFRPKITD
jgi:GAF domain-containing protein